MSGRRAGRGSPAREPGAPDRRAGIPRLVGVPGVASTLSLVGLLLVAVLSFGLLGGPIPDFGLVHGSKNVSTRTPDPIKVLPADQAQQPQPPQVRGTILVVKAGNIWSVSGADVLTQLSTGGHDSSPAWSPDGATIYFIQTLSKKAMVPYLGNPSPYTLEYPAVMRMTASGTARKEIQDGLYSLGGGEQYFYWLLQPDVSPDGKAFALISDSTDPFNASVALSTMPVTGGKVTRLPVGEASYYGFGLGQNDPTWSPDGRTIAYTYNDKLGAFGSPRIALYNVKTKTARFLTPNGYAQPSWSPDGLYLAAVRVTARGRDVVILDARTGKELLAITDNFGSFAPVWSPAGDQIAFLRSQGETIDLELATLGGHAPSFTVAHIDALTGESQLDGTSRPAWFVPAGQMPTPSPSVASPAAGSSGGPASSAAPASSPAASTGP